ncbi:MAG TPA: DUF4340 domain-containing protein [Vicinamibacterales bacterium]|nr:DUF4340 domain-containing protein [Vicinamibacterales bacterium]
MRGGKSLLVLLVLALGLGAYIYFVEAKRDLADPSMKKEKIFAIDTSKVEEVEVKAASGEVTRLKKNGTTWQITAPSTMEADQSEVSTLLTTLESLEIQRTLDEKPASVKEFELDPPRLAVGVRLTGETAMRRVYIGSKTPTGADLYGMVEGQPKLILVSSYVDDQLNRTPFSFREKSVLKFPRDGVDALTIEAAGSPGMTLSRKGNDWRFLKPVDAKADFGSVDGVISKIAQAKMKAIVAPEAGKPEAELTPADLKKYGFDKPQAVATIGAGSTRATLAVGSKVDDTTLYARDLSRPMVFTVESSLLEELKRKPDDLRVKDVFEFRSFTALGVDFTYGGQTYTFEKQKAASEQQSTTAEVWRLTKPAVKDVDQTKITDLLTTISNLRADTFTDKGATSGEELTVTARHGEAASPAADRVVLRKSGAVVHAIRTGEPGAAVVPAADFDKAIALLKELTGAK